MKGLPDLSLNNYNLVYYLHDYNTPQFDLTTPVSRPEVKVDVSFIKEFIKELAEKDGCVADTKRYSCVCGHKIKCIFVIQHRETNELYLLGRDCIKNLFPSMTHVVDKLKKECTKFNESNNYIKRTTTSVTEDTNLFTDLYFSFVKRGMRNMNKIKEHIDTIRHLVKKKNDEKFQNKRSMILNIKRYYFNVLYNNALHRFHVLEQKHIYNTVLQELKHVVGSKRRMILRYYFNVLYNNYLHRLHLLEHKYIYNTVLQELKRVVGKKKQYIPKNQITFIGSDYIKTEIDMYKQYYNVNKLPKFVSRCELCNSLTGINVYTIISLKPVIMCSICRQYYIE